MAYRGETESCKNFEPTTIARRQSLDTDFTSQNLTVEIVLPRIPDGVQVDSKLLGHVGKLKYSNHDVSDKTKYMELALRFFMQNIVVNQLGETIS